MGANRGGNETGSDTHAIDTAGALQYALREVCIYVLRVYTYELQVLQR
jgi:hypothetical protein